MIKKIIDLLTYIAGALVILTCIALVSLFGSSVLLTLWHTFATLAPFILGFIIISAIGAKYFGVKP